ncbi:N-acetylglucosamine/diacetylchitobiose ABC transporter substrate-binding protein [Brachybacterium sp. GCM10030268]|uniref:N-acetylglucosamine/diacetylchitobiose ABC transporter substrate-binding protein n=1 Tax=Brachybacterium sp. GCM10030268 TaxID=3273382 RepID=UPI00361E1AA3
MNDSESSSLETPLDRLGASRRRFLALASSGTGAAALSACAAGGGGGDDDSGGAAPEGGGDVSDDNPFGVAGSDPVEVIVFDGGYGDQYAVDAGEKYSELYPDAEVDVSSTVNIQSDLQTRFIGGDPPDLFDNAGAQSMNASALISEGSIADIGALIEAPSLDGGTVGESLLPGVLDPGTYSGTVYAINYVYEIFALWYSASQFEEKGWEPPRTWDEVMTIAEAAASEDLAMFPWGGQNAADYYHELALSMAIKEAGPDLSRKLDLLEDDVYHQDAVVAAFTAIEDAVSAGYFMAGGAGIQHTEAQTQWVTGNAVMYPSGSWIENEQAGVTPEDYRMTGVPAPMLTDAAAMGEAAVHGTAGEPFFVPAEAANGAGGMEFLRIMLSKQQCQNFSEITSSMTVVKDTIPEDAFGSTALASVNEMITAAGEDVFNYNFAAWYNMGTVFKPLWAEFLNGDITADQAIERSQAAIDEVREDDGIEKFDVE